MLGGSDGRGGDGVGGSVGGACVLDRGRVDEHCGQLHTLLIKADADRT